MAPKRKADQGQEPTARKRGHTILPCPHTTEPVRFHRHAKEKAQCPICLEDYGNTPVGGERVIPVRMGCQHMFCRNCIEQHLSSSIRCPLPWCESQPPLQPEDCNLCAYWQKTHADHLVVTVRAKEMADSIRYSLNQLAAESSFFKLPKKASTRLMSYICATLKQYEWQYHSGIDLAELLDPFLRAFDRDAARKYYGAKLYNPAPDPILFPPRTHDPDDYPLGQEPWIAAFLRQWGLEYEKDNGEAKEGWGIGRWDTEDKWEWQWPYKRIISHKTGEDGRIKYLVQWIGVRYPASWEDREQLDDSHAIYDEEHGIMHAA